MMEFIFWTSILTPAPHATSTTSKKLAIYVLQLFLFCFQDSVMVEKSIDLLYFHPFLELIFVAWVPAFNLSNTSAMFHLSKGSYEISGV